MTESTPQPSRRSPAREFAMHVITMPGWHKGLLLLATTLAAAGLATHAVGWMNHPTPVVQPQNSSTGAGAPTPSSSSPGAMHAFDTSQGTPSSGTPAPTEAPAPTSKTPAWTPWATRVGVSYLAGFVLGWIFRAFIKTMAILTLLGAGLLGGLSYMNVLNVDMTSAQKHYSDATAWVTDQAGRLKDLVFKELPSTSTAAAGLFIGFRRR